LASAEISILFCHFQLCSKNYRWWWRSFWTAGSTALYIFAFGFLYFLQIQGYSFATLVMYFGYMGLVSLGLFMMWGYIGVISSLWFNKKVYSSIKME
jgi:transmembrane 9 superfamily protein 2/4